METRIIDNRLDSITRYQVQTQPSVPEAAGVGSIVTQRPMDTQRRSAGLMETQRERLVIPLENLPDAVENLNGLVQATGQTGVRFEIDRESGRSVVKVVNAEGEVLHRIPPEQFLDLVARVHELVGLFFDEVA
jgi:flagellar protein FlaG